MTNPETEPTLTLEARTLVEFGYAHMLGESTPHPVTQELIPNTEFLRVYPDTESGNAGRNRLKKLMEAHELVPGTHPKKAELRKYLEDGFKARFGPPQF